MNRYRVRSPNQEWNDKGPDLLRTRDNTLAEVRGKMGHRVENWHVRREEAKGWDEWGPPLSKRDALSKLGTWSPTKKGLSFQLGRQDREQSPIEPEITIEFEEVRLLDVGVNERAEIIHSLVTYQFPKAKFAGGYVCKEYNGVPGAGWSDHAWHDAVDESLYGENDRGTDWSIRMAKSRNMEVAYIEGSLQGRVGVAHAPDFGWDLGGDSSHEWHIHYSAVDHDGRNPGCR
jgi:hypothetical protein